MKLSIITINYNNCAGLKKTIESVKAQTFHDYEWIVIDGGSADGSKELIEANANHFSFWCSEPDSGIYNAMNKGLRYAKGDYLQFLNSGDYLCKPETLSSVFSNDYLGDVLFGNFIWEEFGYNQKFPEELPFSFFLDNSLCHQAKFYKKDIFNTYQYDESLSIVSDWALDIQLVLAGKRFQHINENIVFFQSGGISSSYYAKNLEERKYVIDFQIPYHLRLELPVIKKNNFIKKRQLFIKLLNASYKICELLNPLLLKIDKIRHNIR